MLISEAKRWAGLPCKGKILVTLISIEKIIYPLFFFRYSDGKHLNDNVFFFILLLCLLQDIKKCQTRKELVSVQSEVDGIQTV